MTDALVFQTGSDAAMLIAFLIPTLIVVILTFMPLWRNEAWWVRVLDFPRLQIWIISLTLLLLESALLDFAHVAAWMLLFFSGVCFFYQAWWILPYTPLVPAEVKTTHHGVEEQQAIRIMTANVLATNRNAAALIELVRRYRPDVLVTLESDRWWQEQLDTIEAEYPHTIKCPLDNLYGMHVYSRLTLKDSRIDYLVEPDKPSMHTLVMLPSGQPIRVHFLHPAPPGPTKNEESSERDAELVIVAKSVADADLPVVVTGDLNDVAWSETTRLFRKISGLLDPRVGRGMFNTFHADYWFMRWPLDHLFHSDHFTLSRLKRLRGFGSDHFALLTELALDRSEKARQDGIDADSDDRSWAESKADDEHVDKNDTPEPEKG